MNKIVDTQIFNWILKSETDDLGVENGCTLPLNISLYHLSR